MKTATIRTVQEPINRFIRASLQGTSRPPPSPLHLCLILVIVVVEIKDVVVNRERGIGCRSNLHSIVLIVGMMGTLLTQYRQDKY